MRKDICLLSGGLILVLSGCYTYTPVAVDEVSPGASVRARISLDEAERLSMVLGREDRVLEGELLAKAEDGVVVSVPTAREPTGTSMQRLHQRVLIPQTQIVEIEVQRVDRWKTGGLIAAAALLAGYFVVQQFGDPSPGSQSPLPPSKIGEAAVVPWRR